MLESPSIKECAAVAAPASTEAGEDEVAIFFVEADDASVTEAEVERWCEDRLPAFAMPKYVIAATELPMTPSGKVRKLELRERVEKIVEGSVA